MVLYRSVKNAAVNASRLKFKRVTVEFWGAYGSAFRVRYPSINLIIQQKNSNEVVGYNRSEMPNRGIDLA